MNDKHGSAQLCWNDQATILGGLHWRLATPDGSYRTTLHALVRHVSEDVAHSCVDAHVEALTRLLEATDELQGRLVEALGRAVAGTPGAVDADSPVGGSCRLAAAAVDAMLYELSRGMAELAREPDATVGRLVLDAGQISLYLRSLIGQHRWPRPSDEADVA